MNTGNISVIEPLEKALGSTVQILFRPFDLGKWFTIGFCAFLAYLGSGGGGGGGTGFHSGGKNPSGGFERCRDYVVANLAWIIPLGATLLVVGFLVWLVLLWLSSRGQFMFLHCVTLNKAEVAVPWRMYEREGNNLFFFRAIVHLGFIVPIVMLVITGVLAIWPVAENRALAPIGIALLIAVVLAAIALGILFWIFIRLIEDFVVPIMAGRRISSMLAWRSAMGLVRSEAGAFALYLLFRIVLSVAAGAIVLALVVVTCCIAGCIMAIPYLGTVLLLPLLVFQRGYSLHFLAQFGPEYDSFNAQLPAETV